MDVTAPPAITVRKLWCASLHLQNIVYRLIQ
jgi:hypothetical protein